MRRTVQKQTYRGEVHSLELHAEGAYSTPQNFDESIQVLFQKDYFDIKCDKVSSATRNMTVMRALIRLQEIQPQHDKYKMQTRENSTVTRCTSRQVRALYWSLSGTNHPVSTDVDALGIPDQA